MSSASLKMSIGALYLVGGCLLVPGFLDIIPQKVIQIPIALNNITHRPCHLPAAGCKIVAFTPYIPIFDADEYSRGVNILIVGMVLILAAAIVDLVFVHWRASRHSSNESIKEPMMEIHESTDSEKHGGWGTAMRLASPICQVLGAGCILIGCIIFLPQYSNPPPTVIHKGNRTVTVPSKGPVEIWGVSAPDLGNDFFQASAVLYFIGAVIAIIGIAPSIDKAKRAGRSTAALWATILAFLLFICVSTLFFANARLPKESAIEAGKMRLAASACLLCAIVILTVVTIVELRSQKMLTAPVHNQV